jgi:hypothetical protein
MSNDDVDCLVKLMVPGDGNDGFDSNWHDKRLEQSRIRGLINASSLFLSGVQQ